MARRRYGTFTPARREALRKAQLASAAKRRRAGRIRTAKRIGVGVGILAVGAGAAYGGHRLAGNQFTVSRGHTTYPGEKKNSVIRYGTGSIGVHHTNRKDKQTILLYARGVRKNVHGSKISGAPHKVTEYKPSNADIKNMARHNRSKPYTEQYARDAMIIGHSTAHTYQHRKIEHGEAIRRTNSYVTAMEAKGKKISAAHRSAALKYFANQPRYPGGTVKPLKRQSRRKFRRTYNKQMGFAAGPTVLGSRKKAG